MSGSFIETSFCFPLYVDDVHTAEAKRLLKSSEILLISPLLRFEFMQSVRLKMFYYTHNFPQSFSRDIGAAVLENFSADLEAGVFSMRGFDYRETMEIAEDLSARYTRAQGYRSFDILHVAAALQMKADRFLSFDAAQKKLAKAAGLRR